VQAKGIGNTFNKIIAENFPSLKKEMPIQVQEVSRTPNRHDQNRTSLQNSKAFKLKCSDESYVSGLLGQKTIQEKTREKKYKGHVCERWTCSLS
jgi:hypothetical protein